MKAIVNIITCDHDSGCRNWVFSNQELKGTERRAETKALKEFGWTRGTAENKDKYYCPVCSHPNINQLVE